MVEKFTVKVIFKLAWLEKSVISSMKYEFAAFRKKEGERQGAKTPDIFSKGKSKVQNSAPFLSCIWVKLVVPYIIFYLLVNKKGSHCPWNTIILPIEFPRPRAGLNGPFRSRKMISFRYILPFWYYLWKAECFLFPTDVYLLRIFWLQKN